MTTVSAPFLWRSVPQAVELCDNPPVACTPNFHGEGSGDRYG
ncbi:hypothetical protein HDF16_004221 [Granulicella aggregans]|uniref:Uncharacterized protein n=1 Tax=Granulicella aggregans TaxID=474949 RepID=A0A7W8E6Q3_9BACT|nr:hypothetical protein [Granulicella aggregans]MBB5059495.1 hypothetical protein [Granulicella aggregans]